jgi:hypothetical protein
MEDESHYQYTDGRTVLRVTLKGETLAVARRCADATGDSMGRTQAKALAFYEAHLYDTGVLG